MNIVHKNNDRLVVNISLGALVIYNLLFFGGKFGGEYLPSFFETIYSSFSNSIGFLTILEIIGVVAIFFDLIWNYDQYGERNIGLRRLRLVLIGLIIMAFFFKLFINYLDSALMMEN